MPRLRSLQPCNVPFQSPQGLVGTVLLLLDSSLTGSNIDSTMSGMASPQIDIPKDRIAQFCLKWKVVRLSLFGSVLREDFGPDSDVDVLILLENDAPWDLFDWVDMIEELKSLFRREVDLVEETAISNPFRRREILNTRQVIYAA